jgi:hypothetical protein
VVDRCAAEAPHTLLLAEAFWMMEGYFVRTLGMHRVYNSAFMNMLKNEENAKYRATIKNTLEFDPEILKRFVNFMNNPDEDTAVAQFGKGDKYFGIATLLVTMPGLPMFGHGQIEGFEEKYGMEYRRSYKDEKPDKYLIERHEREIFPLMKKRHVFSGSSDFCLYDLIGAEGTINENVFAYSNRAGGDMALVFYNNSYQRATGWIRRNAVANPLKDGAHQQETLCGALSLHSESRYFTIFREQRSGAWYIRSSKDLAERGLFVGLNGYEAQVFLDIHETADTPDAAPGSWDARWARLNHELNGRGVRDIEAALLDIYLGSLYEPFNRLFKSERMEQFARFFAPNATGAAGKTAESNADARNESGKRLEFIDYFREPVRDFANAAAAHLPGTAGGYAAFQRDTRERLSERLSERSIEGLRDERAKLDDERERLDDERAKLDDERERLSDAPATADAVWEQFAAYLDRLVRLADTPAAEYIAARPQNAALVFGYAALTLLRSVLGANGATGAEAARLADHWQLIRKVKASWEKLGLSAHEAARMAELARAVLSRTAPPPSPAGAVPPAAAPASAAITADRIAASIIYDNYEADDFRTLLGINRFEDTTWFNKEAFEEAVTITHLFLLPESPAAFTNPGLHTGTAGGTTGPTPGTAGAAWKTRIETITAIAGPTGSLMKAEAASAYRLDTLLDLLSGTPPHTPPPPPAKPPHGTAKAPTATAKAPPKQGKSQHSKKHSKK